MRLLGNLTLSGGGSLENARFENLATDPVTPFVGQMWYNTTSGAYKGYDGSTLITFASGGNADAIQTELNAVEAAVGLNTDGTLAAYSATNYLNAASTLKAATILLDTRAKTNTDAIATAVGVTSTLQSEVDATQAGAGLSVAGAYVPHAGANYIASATTLDGADVLLDTATKAAADAATAASDLAALKVAKAGDSMAGNLAFGGLYGPTGIAAPTNAGDAANKAYVDNLINGLTWLPPADSSGASTPAYVAQANGYRFLNTTDAKIYTVAAASFGAGVLMASGSAVMVRDTDAGWTSNGTAVVQFTGAGQITAGVGLSKSGNVIDVNLGAGIAQLPSDEVGIDCLNTGGLFLTVDGTTASTLTGAQLSVLLNGATLDLSASGLKIAAQGVTATEIATSVAGAGLTGGGGTAMAVGAGTGVTVNANDVALDLTYADGRYINTAGDTMTGSLTLSADPTTALMAATMQYVDAVTTRLVAGTYQYVGSSASTTHVVTHGLGQQYNQVTVYDSANKVIMPDSITADSVNQLTIVFASAISCKAVVSSVKV